jgi:hypothetical protein
LRAPKIPAVNSARGDPPVVARMKGAKVSGVKLVVLYPTPTDV